MNAFTTLLALAAVGYMLPHAMGTQPASGKRPTEADFERVWALEEAAYDAKQAAKAARRV